MSTRDILSKLRNEIENPTYHRGDFGIWLTSLPRPRVTDTAYSELHLATSCAEESRRLPARAGARLVRNRQLGFLKGAVLLRCTGSGKSEIEMPTEHAYLA